VIIFSAHSLSRRTKKEEKEKKKKKKRKQCTNAVLLTRAWPCSAAEAASSCKDAKPEATIFSNEIKMSPTQDELNKQKVPELKQALAALGLPQTGVKSDLVQRVARLVRLSVNF